MAEIAAIFHWPLRDLVRLPIEELLFWREQAVKCWNRMNAQGKG